MAAPKIIYGHFSPEALFSYESAGFFSNDKSYFVPGGDWFLLGLLNSRALWWLLSGMAPPVRGGFHEVRVQYVETLPVPKISADMRERLEMLAQKAQHTAEARRDLLASFRRRILTDLAPGGASAKLTKKLADWYQLDFKAFHEEVKKQFKQPIPLSERDDWQALFESNKIRIEVFSAEIARHVNSIDQIVYKLFGLTNEEVALISFQ